MDVRNLVFIDEAGIHLGMVRLFGRAVRGQRAVDTVPRNRQHERFTDWCTEPRRFDRVNDT